MATWTYTINDDNSVTVTNGTSSSLTKAWGNGAAFTAETAATWGDATVAALNDPTSEMVAGSSPEEPTVSRLSVMPEEPIDPWQQEPLEIEAPAE